ncbi:hypothetical protein HRS9139_02111 [Pyrenophora teres f. teres]|uniref:Uncharacterized protein n=1 Tax=Pyrenophora teres f. teres TaxID=97479 RepID=A0A6S6VVR7_9PLEO|nr:hypothetical protein HRS9139_02111 [Pyrenophora teres f. teres]KAE8870512.1 hypothetical protein PTNB29_00856 [Pyrenophora teres f. teres]CAA9960690.1 hypothetical protein PTMSG1_04074 [Pyrenophora teres f. maculata]CAE7012566.1 hypothetical protein PTTW11_02375 [Pyrenophora teres f. teres]
MLLTTVTFVSVLAISSPVLVLAKPIGTIGAPDQTPAHTLGLLQEQCEVTRCTSNSICYGFRCGDCVVGFCSCPPEGCTGSK